MSNLEINNYGDRNNFKEALSLKNLKPSKNIEIRFDTANKKISDKEINFSELMKKDCLKNLSSDLKGNVSLTANPHTDAVTVIGCNDKPVTIPNHGIHGMLNREIAGHDGLSGKMREQIEKGNYKEYTTESPSEEMIDMCMAIFGKTREQAIAGLNKMNKENKVKNEKLNNTKASNGMSYPEAKRTYMRLYEKYIMLTRVTCPGADGNLCHVDVDPSKLKEKMSPADLELFEKAKAAMTELQKNVELMSLYEYSKTASLERNFNLSHCSDGSYVGQWRDTKYVKEVPYS